MDNTTYSFRFDCWGGWQGAAWQALMIFVTGAIYWPFAKKYDAILVQQEKEAYEAEQAEQA